ncbi:MAG: hypothetical protein NTX86_05520 [Candidatus Dependentiae bacterium]|nr:hypothetical protein [Candidatus Dependentiae bacterium]
MEHAQLANTIEYHNHTYEEKNTWKSYGRNIANGATHSIGSHLGSDLYSLVKNRIFSAKQKQTNQNDNDDLSTIIALQQMLDQEAEQLKNMSEVIESLENDPIRADACKKMKNQLTVLSLQHMEKRMHLAGYGQQKKPTTATAPVYQSKLAEQKQEQQTPPATGTTIA